MIRHLITGWTKHRNRPQNTGIGQNRRRYYVYSWNRLRSVLSWCMDVDDGPKNKYNSTVACNQVTDKKYTINKMAFIPSCATSGQQ